MNQWIMNQCVHDGDDDDDGDADADVVVCWGSAAVLRTSITGARILIDFKLMLMVFLMFLISLNSYMGFRNHLSGTHDPFMEPAPFV